MPVSLPCLLACAACLLAAPAVAQVAESSPEELPDSLRRLKKGYSLLRPVPQRLMRPLSTDRPDATESAYSVDAGHFQLETDLVRFGQQRFGTARSEEVALNHINLKMGLTRTSDVQVIVESYTLQTERSETRTQRSGFGDLTVRFKQNLWGNDGGTTALALLPFVKLPTANKVGNGAVEGGLVTPFAWQLPGDWSFGSQLQLNVSRDAEAQEHFLEFAPTITVGHDLYQTLGGFVELATNRDLRRGGLWTATFNGGPTLRIGDNLQLDAGWNLALTRDTETSYFLGLSFRR
ncbi:transporter [Hymenobacter busanensis]|uniref:Transporter n=1 Tax=Hymenobacter busanensis TaxID=2607656 RepID=A0A7L4ZZU1_9BACT|nr:transporter [Hymenobacter busanensis]KAA9331627.1 transporter [Hymenobacter busanensis]QHJ08778.1 transporter [Hymenobacter busanensis]